MATKDLSHMVCQRCKHDRFSYEGHEGKHIIMPFAIPADSPLDDESIKKFAVMFADMVTRTLREHRKGKGKSSSLILLS